MTGVATRIAENLAGITARVASAAQRGGRKPGDVRIVAVTKYVGLSEIEALVAAGCGDLGESRPQELWRKAEGLRSASASITGRAEVHWHLVGNLQRNKVRRTLPLVKWIHSADSLRLLEEIEREAGEIGCRPRVLLEVNVSGEPAKHGFQPEELGAIVPQLSGFTHFQVCGLMGMASFEGGADVARRNFAALRELRDRLSPACPPNISLTELSMGMSGDFEIAVEEGATVVRIGSALFEGIT